LAVLKPRTRLISFRLSEEEYLKLRGACLANGARSISEFARQALQRTVSRGSDPTGNLRSVSLGLNAKELIDTMQELNHRLGQLVSIVRPD
jgi:hypothetical protein